MIGSLLGGVGLFMLGMGLLTDGLQAAAGDSLRDALRRYTRTRWSALLAGISVTALTQSSSVTVLVTVGFVGAGLIPFAQALGVIYGANVGSTVTSWLVATVGLKMQMSALALPLVGVGALGKLVLRGRRSALAMALAGLGLLFVGIDVLQSGMTELTRHVDPASFALPGIGGAALLVVVGVVMTVVMQSSGAAVAATLAAVNQGALGLEQAAALVIGQNLGTTVKAVLGAVGGTTAARRIAFAHVFFNVGTGAVAFALLPLFLGVIVRGMEVGDPALALTAFHTAFNVLGVVLFLPMSHRMVRLLERWVPDEGRSLTAHLSRAAAELPAVAVEAARKAAAEIAAVTFDETRRVLLTPGKSRGWARQLDELNGALRATREHLHAVRSDPAAPAVYREHVAVLHVLDHLHRLVEALAETELAAGVSRNRVSAALAPRLAEALAASAPWARDPSGPPPPVEALSQEIALQLRRERQSVLENTARGVLSPRAASRLLESLRWLDRVGYHLFRAVHHLERADKDLPPADPPAPESEGRRADESYEVHER